MEKYFGTQEVAKLCQVAQGTVIRWIKEGKLAAASTAGGHHRILSEDLAQFLKNLRLPIPDELRGTDKKRILIVDDEPEVRKLLRWMIEQNFPATIIEEAEEGFVAGWKVRGFLPDLVILDLMIPGVNGYHVCEFIRHLPQLKNIKIIAMSALMDPDVEKKFRDLGANEVLTKPINIDVFKEKVNKCFEINGEKKGKNHE